MRGLGATGADLGAIKIQDRNPLTGFAHRGFSSVKAGVALN